MKHAQEGGRTGDSYSVRSIERAIRVLKCFSFQLEERTLGELAQLTNLSKSTVFRILQTLEKHRFVTYRSLSNHYCLGMALLELGGVVLASLSLRKAATRVLDQLEAKLNHVVLLAILDEGELVYIDRREGNDPIKINSEIGKRRPPYFGMLGKTLMAFLSDERVDDLLNRFPLRKIAPRSIISRGKFKKSLKEIREKGYTYEYNEAVEGQIGIAAPIRNHQREVMAAIGVGIPSFNADDREIKEVIEIITESAKQISFELGFFEVSELVEGKRVSSKGEDWQTVCESVSVNESRCKENKHVKLSARRRC